MYVILIGIYTTVEENMNDILFIDNYKSVRIKGK
jgi:hypothetical protein